MLREHVLDVCVQVVEDIRALDSVIGRGERDEVVAHVEIGERGLAHERRRIPIELRGAGRGFGGAHRLHLAPRRSVADGNARREHEAGLRPAA